MPLSPVVIQALTSIAVLFGIGLAVLGQYRWRAVQEWEALAEARAQRITLLEKEIEALRTETNGQREQIAALSRLNLDLQRRLQAGN